jgi:integrase
MLDDLLRDLEQRQVKDLVTPRFRINALKKKLGSIPATELTERQIDLYMKDRYSSGRKAATVQCELQYLLQAFRIAKRKKLVKDIPHIPSMRVKNARQGFFEQPDFERVVSFLPEHLKDVTRFAYYSSWRKNEITALKWRDIADGVIRLPPQRVKNSEPRILMLIGVIAEIIERRRKEQEDLVPYVFHRHGKKIGRFDETWALACRKAGLPDKLFHDFRRTAIRNMVRAGVPERIAMQISGHKTRSIFERYNIVNEEDIERAQRQTFQYLEAKKVLPFRTPDGQHTRENP